MSSTGILRGAATGLLSLALASTANGADWTTRYVVRFDGPQAKVTAHLTWNGGRGMRPDAVELGMADDYEDESGKGYGRFVRDFEAHVPEGSKAPREGYAAAAVDAELGSYRVPVLEDGGAGYRYTVLLEHVPREALGFDETPHTFAGGTFWTGRSLFVHGPDSDYEVALEAAPGQHVSTSLDPLEKRPGVFTADEWYHLRQTYFVVGEHFQVELDLRGATVIVALDDPLAEEQELVVGQIRSFLEAGSALLDGRPPARSLCFVESHDSEGGGAVVRRDAHVLVPPPPVAEQDDQWRRSLCHELFHLWNPNLVGFDSREMWYSEGFTEYWSHRLLVRTDSIDGRAFLGHVRGWAIDYLGEVGEIGLRQAGELGAKNNTLIYQGGALAAFCLDVGLRDEHANRRGLDEVMRALYELCGSGAGHEISIDELQELLEKLGGRDLEDFLERHVAGAEPLPLTEAFATAGLTFSRETLQVPERDSAALLIQTSGMTALGHGILIQRTNAGKLKTNDVLLEVDGHPTDHFDGLREALAGRAPGDKVPAVVLRKNERVEIELRLGGHGEELESAPREITRLRPVAKPSRKARAIRAELFPGI